MIFTYAKRSEILVLSKLYTVVQSNYEPIHGIISARMAEMINARSWYPAPSTSSTSRSRNLTGIIVFETLTVFYYQYV